MQAALLKGIFVGEPAPLGAGGTPSAFVKRPVEGAVDVGAGGLAGDRQADLRVHGGPDMAVYAYPFEHYDEWMSEFPEHAALWGMGSLGENLSMEGWDEAGVCVGDTVRIGAVLMQVTRPRKPCFKLALRFDDLRLPRRLTQTGRCGWYFRVLEGGRIASGALAELIERPNPAWPIRRLNDLSANPGADADALAELAEVPELAENWRAQVNAALSTLRTGGRSRVFRDFRIAGTQDESRSIRSFLLEPADGGGPPPVQPGQHIVVRGEGSEQSRAYSVSALPVGHLRISVKREPGGFSEWLHLNAKQGDRLRVLGPRGSFVWAGDTTAPLVLISAGVGITPMMAMLQAAATNNGSRCVPESITFIHGARRSADHAFADQTREIAGHHPSVRRHVRFSAPGSEDVLGRTHDSVGRIDEPLLADLLRGLVNARIYICGPPSFILDVTRWVGELALPGAEIFTETFGAPQRAPGADASPMKPEPPSEAQIHFDASGGSSVWRPGMSLLDVAEAGGVAIESECRSGICGRCATPIVSGRTGYQLTPFAETTPGEVLLCCAYPVDCDVHMDL
ncbi:MOSC and FAD-binding oxidoreductase domain-containing protein [Xanthobacter sp. KR7-65]|uniref:MOSC and FAD-binding oxidoreductase domain-containing protein n=1 Tax=Xanthobacter sp. KR7-65 TaxID=3156612 RepID=UPI0032B37EA5